MGKIKIQSSKSTHASLTKTDSSHTCICLICRCYWNCMFCLQLISKDLVSVLREHYPCSIFNLSRVDPEEVFLCDSSKDNIFVFIIPTVDNGSPPACATWFCKWLNEAATDFRIEKSSYSAIKYSVFGAGNSLYQENFNKV